MSDRLRGRLAAASVLLWAAGSGWACGSTGGTAAGEGEEPASTATSGLTASALVAAPDPDAPPPVWLPPGYTEIPWEKAAEVIHARDVDRVFRTQTRRAYVVTRKGDKHFTIEPSRGAMKALLREADDGTFLQYEMNEIPWQEAAEHIREGRTRGVSILHFSMVMVGLKGQGPFLAIAPGEEEVRKVLREVSPPIEPTIE